MEPIELSIKEVKSTVEPIIHITAKPMAKFTKPTAKPMAKPTAVPEASASEPRKRIPLAKGMFCRMYGFLR